MTALRASSWAGVKEVGEDYSLWLTNLNRSHYGDTLQVTLDVHLRTETSEGEALRRSDLSTRTHASHYSTIRTEVVRASHEHLLAPARCFGLGFPLHTP
jgi:hypothetical protein